jgi:outer membrane protein OmpA-like peptidoglycan-associated protein
MGALVPGVLRAQSRLQKAQALWSHKQYEAAIALLQKELQASEKQSADYYATLGSWLYQNGRFPEAITVFQAAARNTPKGEQAFRLPLGRSLFRAGRYREAVPLVQGITTHPEALWLTRAATWAAAQQPEAVVPESLGPRINTRHPETFPQLTAAGQCLYYTRRTRGIDDDLMRAVPDTCGGWLGGIPLPVPINSPRQERAQLISPDGHYIFFGREDLQSEDGWTGGGADLYMAYTVQSGDTAWSVPQPFGATINTPAYEGMPALTADNQTLYFVSDRAGGLGGFDIWYSRFERGLWQTPLNAGPAVNTPGNELSPFLGADGQTLFFASNGHTQNFGGYDLYRVTRIDTIWKQTQNLGLPINSPHDELCPALGIRGDTLYYATDRDGPAGNTDLWRVALPPIYRPAAVQWIQGQILDSLEGDPVPQAWVEVTETTSGKSVGSFRSNRGDGSFSVFLIPGGTYQLTASHLRYQSGSALLTVDTAQTEQPFRMALLPKGYVAPKHDSMLLRLYFRKNEVTLTDAGRQALAALFADGWPEGAEVLVWSFTDNSGTPLINEEISAVRAQVVATALRQTGILEAMLTTQGWGEAQPLAPNLTETDRDQNRRVEIWLRK